jgi:hypothetical protein
MINSTSIYNLTTFAAVLDHYKCTSKQQNKFYLTRNLYSAFLHRYRKVGKQIGEGAHGMSCHPSIALLHRVASRSLVVFLCWLGVVYRAEVLPATSLEDGGVRSRDSLTPTKKRPRDDTTANATSSGSATTNVTATETPSSRQTRYVNGRIISGTSSSSSSDSKEEKSTTSSRDDDGKQYVAIKKIRMRDASEGLSMVWHRNAPHVHRNQIIEWLWLIMIHRKLYAKLNYYKN